MGAYLTFVLLMGTVLLNKSFSNLLKRKTIFEGLPGAAAASIKLQTLILAILNSI